MRLRFGFIAWITFLFIAGASPESARADTPGALPFQIITHPANTESQINLYSLEQILLGEQVFWPGGEKLTAFHGDAEAEPMKGIISNVLHLDSDRFQAHWRRKVFSGRGLPPRSLQSDTMIIQEVAHTKGALGIIASGSKPGPEVKSLKVIN
jgi:hypothetical protein